MGNSNPYIQILKIDDRRSRKDRRLVDAKILIGTDRRCSIERRSRIERRKQNRFRVKDGAFAAKSSEINIVGPIQNISGGGLTFRYVGKRGQIDRSLEVDLFCTGEGYCFTKLPSKTIYDFRIDKKASDSALTIRRCGVQFDELTDHQMSHIEDFIQKYGDKGSGKDC